MSDERLVGEEASKSHPRRVGTGFVDAYLSGAHILDIGYKGYREDIVPIVPQAIGVELDYPGYDGRTLPFPDESQDAVFSSHCLEHIPDSTQALRDWFRVLRVGGFMVIMVPHQFLYEKRIALPSRFNEEHQRFYTPAALLADIEAVLPPNSYRVRHLADNDDHFDYTIPPDRHSGGCYEIELVIEKITAPAWNLVVREPSPAARPSMLARLGTAVVLDPLRTRERARPQVRVLPAEPWNLALYDFSTARPGRRRLLALQLGHFGDFIIGLPALRQLRAAFPEDFIHLIVGSWNRGEAEACGLADEVGIHDYFPEVARNWNGKPVQDAEAFAEATPGHYDIAIDLRVDEDTRHLLQFVDAGTRCGIGAAARFAYLDVVLPYDHTLRSTDRSDRLVNVLLGPERFHSRMPVQKAFRHENDFTISNQHVVYGPYIRLPLGRYRATFGLQLTGLRLGLRRVRIHLDVARGGSTVLAERDLTADQLGASIGDGVQLEFDNPDDRETVEFRIHLAHRPLRASLAFSGVRLDEIESTAAARWLPAELHTGEHQALLVRLVADRLGTLYPAASAAPRAPATGRRQVVIAPVSNSDLRDWPVEHYVALVAMLVERLDCEVRLIGSRAQFGALAHIVQASGFGQRVENLAGRTAWSEIPAVLREADLVICNNSGIAHLAASLGTRTLAIYSASHQPQEWGPRGPQSRALMAMVPCSPCGYDRLSDCPNDHVCLRQLPPDAVFAQAASWLQGE